MTPVLVFAALLRAFPRPLIPCSVKSHGAHCSARLPCLSVPQPLSPLLPLLQPPQGLAGPSRHTPILPLWLELFPQMAVFLTAFKLNKRTAGPGLQWLAWLPQLGLDILLLHINNFTEHQCPDKATLTRMGQDSHV